MRYGVLGTGEVGRALATALVGCGHEVRIGSRSATNEVATTWAAESGGRASAGTFADAAIFGERILNCTSGFNSLDALRAAGADNLGDKALIDVANPLDTSGRPDMRLSVVNDDSLAEQIQREFPTARVVKTLNTMHNQVMVRPSLVPGRHTVFVCGDDASAKAEAIDMLQGFGWAADTILDLGDLRAARGTEAFLLLWLRMARVMRGAPFNIAVVRGEG